MNLDSNPLRSDKANVPVNVPASTLLRSLRQLAFGHPPRFTEIQLMPNIAAVLKTEISRVARKEVRSETQSLKKAGSTYRSEIAALKRRMQALELALRQAGKVRSALNPSTTEASSSKPHRFSAKGLAAQRKRLGLSAENCGLLIGASSQSV